MQDDPEAAPSEVVDAVLRASRLLVSVAARSPDGVSDDVTLPQVELGQSCRAFPYATVQHWHACSALGDAAGEPGQGV